MLIRKRIILSNILMIVIPVVLIILVTGLLYLSYEKLYDLPKDVWDSDRDKAMWAQHSIEEYLNHLQYSRGSDEEQGHGGDLQEELMDGGFYSSIARNDKTIGSNFTAEAEAQADKIISVTSLPEPTVIQSGSLLLIRDSVEKDGATYTVTAFNPEFEVSRIDWLKQMTVIGTYILILFILSIIIIAATNAIVSMSLSKKITMPLDLLNYGAEQIKNGNLDFKIHYEGKDEFGQAISNFDEMRARLYQSIQSQLKYEEDRKEIVAGISHDLRTPLTAIKGYVKGLKDGVANTPEKQQQYHNVIFNKACEMDVLVDNLFLFSKLDTDHMPFYFEETDCKEYLDGLVGSFKDDFASKGLNIVSHNSCPPGVAIKIDADQLSRVFVNILENSAKYKIQEICNVEFDISLHEAGVIIEISDDGPGVPDEIVSDLFKSFYRGDSSRTNSNGSSGLGLSIADRIVKAHNGTITAKNKNGLAVIIQLPVVGGNSNETNFNH